MNRPYKSTSLEELVIICKHVPNREVLKAILTELSHRETKQAKNLEAILVQHLINQSGDNTVNALNTATRDNQPGSTIKSGENNRGGRNRPPRSGNPKQIQNPLTQKQQPATTEIKSGDRPNLRASVGNGKTITPEKNADIREGADPAPNRVIADKTSSEMRGAAQPKQKFEKPRNRKNQSNNSPKSYKPGIDMSGWKQPPQKVILYICGLVLVAAIVGYSYFFYSERNQTAIILDGARERPETHNNAQKVIEVPVKIDLAQNSQKRGEASNDDDPAQDINKGLESSQKFDPARDIQKSLEASNLDTPGQGFQSDLNAPNKDDLAQDLQKGLDAFEKGDYPTALREFRILSQQGNAEAQYNLGLLHDRGQGVLEDNEEAARWFRKSAQQGNADAQLMLGIYYYEGEDIPEDHEEAAKWYRKSAEQENADAQNRLGFMYEKGLGVVQDYNEAAKWYRKSAEQGNANAQKNLSARYFLGQGVDQDNVYAHMWANIASSQGHKSAIKIEEIVTKKMTASDISKAKELAGECQRKNYKGC